MQITLWINAKKQQTCYCYLSLCRHHIGILQEPLLICFCRKIYLIPIEILIGQLCLQSRNDVLAAYRCHQFFQFGYIRHTTDTTVVLHAHEDAAAIEVGQSHHFTIQMPGTHSGGFELCSAVFAAFNQIF